MQNIAGSLKKISKEITLIKISKKYKFKVIRNKILVARDVFQLVECSVACRILWA